MSARSIRSVFQACIVTSAVVLTGCQQQGGGGGGGGSAGAQAPAAALAMPEGYSAVKKGKPVLNFIAGTGGSVQVVNLTTQKVALKPTDVPPNSIITIAPRQGVVVNAQVLVKPPLDREHEFEIRLRQPR